MDLKKRLRDAAEAGEVLSIIYNGGSQPGTKRDIVPLSIIDNGEKLLARCLASGEDKTFFIAKLEIVPLDRFAKKYDPKAANPEDIETIADIIASTRKELETLGWHVQSGETSITLHRYFKNGKVRKGPDIGLYWQEFVFDAVFDGTKVVAENERKNSRPWSVNGPDKSTSFFHSGKAVQLFMEQARAHAPSKPTGG